MTAISSPGLLAVGRALSAPARVAMVSTLMDGQEHTATELRSTAGVTAATTSQHLAVLVECGLVAAVRRGRHRWFRIVDEQVAAALEGLGGPQAEVTSLRASREQRRIALARTCYDHLAGRLGVALTEALERRGWVDLHRSTVTPAGDAGLASWGVDLASLRGRRVLVRSCLDWTEQRPHLAGALGAALADVALAQGWVRRREGSRGLTITEGGVGTLQEMGVDLGSTVSRAVAAPAR